jgi:hypothetical protein
MPNLPQYIQPIQYSQREKDKAEGQYNRSSLSLLGSFSYSVCQVFTKGDRKEMDQVEDKMLFPSYAVSNYYNQVQVQAGTALDFSSN